MSKRLRGRCARCVGLAAVALWGCGGGAGSGKVVRFAFVAPLEEFYGAHGLQGAQVARAQLNAIGGIRGRTLEFVVVTDSADPERAVRVADSLYQDPSVLAVIGHANSGTTLAAASIYNQGLPAISYSATSPEVTKAGAWIFRVAPSDAVNGGPLAEFARRRLGARGAILYANEPYGRGLREHFRRAFTAGDGTILEEYPYLEDQTIDFEPYLLSVRAARPDFIFIAGLEGGAALIIRQARTLGITAPFLGGDGLIGLAGRDPLFDGAYVGLLYHPRVPGAPGQALVSAYQARHRVPPDAFAALAYDAVLVAAEAAREGGLRRDRIRDYLAEIGSRRPTVSGATGTIAFDENGDAVGKPFAIGRIAGDSIGLVSLESGT